MWIKFLLQSTGNHSPLPSVDIEAPLLIRWLCGTVQRYMVQCLGIPVEILGYQAGSLIISVEMDTCSEICRVRVHET